MAAILGQKAILWSATHFPQRVYTTMTKMKSQPQMVSDIQQKLSQKNKKVAEISQYVI